MGKVADQIASRVAAITGPEGASEGSEAIEESSQTETPSSSAPSPAERVETIEEASEPPAQEARTEEGERELRKTLLAEKLEAARERRRASAEARARREREGRSQEQIDTELAAAKAEREKWERLKVGSFKDGLKAIGRDPLTTFQELEREAAEANTPEGQIRRLQEEYATRLEAMNRKIASLEEELAKGREERQKERTQAEESALVARFEADFARQIQDPSYRALRVAYDDEEILAYAHAYRKDSERMHHAAKLHGVRLTNPAQGFTMQEILSVLRAAQDSYDTKRKSREAKLSGQSGGQADRSKVNGTDAPEAVSTIGSDLASTRASGEARKQSRQERIEREIDRLERHR